MNVFPDKFRFTFAHKKKDGTEETYVLKYAPDEWNNNVIKRDRDKKTDVISSSYVDTFTFVLEDADFLRNIFTEESIFAKVRFSVDEYDGQLFKYKYYYSGDIDFYSWTETKYNVKVSTLEIGYKISFDANYDTTYEIPLKADETKLLAYDRLILRNEIAMSCDADYNVSSGAIDFILELNISETSNDVVFNKIQTNSVIQGITIKNPKNPFAKALNSVNGLKMNIKFNFDVIARNNPSINSVTKLILKVGNNSIILGSVANGGKIESVFTQPYEFNVSANDEFYIYIQCDTDAMSNRVEKISGNATIDMSYDERSTNTKWIKCAQPSYLLKELINKATYGKYSNIEYKTSLTDSIFLTSGNLIRDIKDATIKTSLKDFFESMRAMFGIAYEFKSVGGIETLIVDHINNLYNKGVHITSVSDIKELETSVNNDYIYNRLKIGYKDQSYDEINGKYEFNTELEFSVATEAKSKELKLVSPYRADMYGIEFLLINYDKKDTTDSNDDNDTFVFNVKETFIPGWYALNRDYNSADSANEPAGISTFNVWLSPKRCLLRQIEYIRSLFSFSGSVLKFASSPKEFNLVSSDGVSEHADIDLTGAKLFDPVSYEFETKVPSNISELLGENYNGYISASNGEKTVSGFILSVSENPGRNKSQKWKLIKMS